MNILRSACLVRPDIPVHRTHFYWRRTQWWCGAPLLRSFA